MKERKKKQTQKSPENSWERNSFLFLFFCLIIQLTFSSLTYKIIFSLNERPRFCWHGCGNIALASAVIHNVSVSGKKRKNKTQLRRRREYLSICVRLVGFHFVFFIITLLFGGVMHWVLFSRRIVQDSAIQFLMQPIIKNQRCAVVLAVFNNICEYVCALHRWMYYFVKFYLKPHKHVFKQDPEPFCRPPFVWN